jgi:hypothetical protein
LNCEYGIFDLSQLFDGLLVLFLVVMMYGRLIQVFEGSFVGKQERDSVSCRILLHDQWLAGKLGSTWIVIVQYSIRVYYD